MKQNQIMINSDKCIGCGLCSNVCAVHNIYINNKKASTKMDSCIKCGQCSAICPQKAISIVDYEKEQIEKNDDISLNPDNVLNVIRFRRSIRKFKETQIPKEVIEQILEAGRLTHTAKNMQDVSFIVLDLSLIHI